MALLQGARRTTHMLCSTNHLAKLWTAPTWGLQVMEGSQKKQKRKKKQWSCLKWTRRVWTISHPWSTFDSCVCKASPTWSPQVGFGRKMVSCYQMQNCRGMSRGGNSFYQILNKRLKPTSVSLKFNWVRNILFKLSSTAQIIKGNLISVF